MKKYLPLIVLGAIIFAGGGYYLYSNKKNTSPKMTEIGTMDDMTTNENDSMTEKEGFVGSIEDALKIGSSMKCTFSYQGVESTAYIKSDKVYYESQYQGKTSYVISKDNCTWSWEDDEGIKVCLDETDLKEGEEMEFEEPQTGDVQVGNYQYDCQPTTVADSKFNLPSNVEFISPQEMIPDLPEDFEMPLM